MANNGRIRPETRPNRKKVSSVRFRGRWSRQHPDRGGLVGQASMRVDVERQPNIAVPGQGLGHLGADAGALAAGDEQMPTRMEIGIAPAWLA